MIKAKNYNLADSNIANLGSELEKNCRLHAGDKEAAWKDAGLKVGLEIWRIEKFQVKAWPKNQYGKFYSGDSYIVLYTYKKSPDAATLAWNIHFWLGHETTQDEAGTAAYKTVELDDHLHGAPVQTREVQGFESDQFMHYFKDGIFILEGGIESGFHHVKPEEYKTRLLQLYGHKHVKVQQVPLSFKSLNSGDNFILDAGLQIFQWNGKHSSVRERGRVAQLVHGLHEEREGRAKVIVMEDGSEEAVFWDLIGGKGPVSNDAPKPHPKDKHAGKKSLHKLSEVDGKLVFTEVAAGKVHKKSLDSQDVFIFDVGDEIFAWIGHKASVAERSKAIQYAHDYLVQSGKDENLPIVKLIEGAENQIFEQAFDA
jgi:gelsolin